MWYILLSLVVLGIVAAILGYFRNKKLQKMLERGEITEIPEPQEIPEECCGQHEVCERDSLLAAVSKSLREVEVAGWLRSLQLRGICLPDELKDEAFLIVGERRIH